VHAMTDVTGFGLLGHLLEVARGSGLNAEIRRACLPLIADAVTHARAGIATGASGRNWASYGEHVALPDDIEPWQRALLTDPQTSGGLLVSCAPEACEAVVQAFRQAGFAEAACIGELSAEGPGPRIQVR